jgi:hypothetical protein
VRRAGEAELLLLYPPPPLDVEYVWPPPPPLLSLMGLPIAWVDADLGEMMEEELVVGVDLGLEEAEEEPL